MQNQLLPQQLNKLEELLNSFKEYPFEHTITRFDTRSLILNRLQLALSVSLATSVIKLIYVAFAFGLTLPLLGLAVVAAVTAFSAALFAVLYNNGLLFPIQAEFAAND